MGKGTRGKGGEGRPQHGARGPGGQPTVVGRQDRGGRMNQAYGSLVDPAGV